MTRTALLTTLLLVVALALPAGADDSTTQPLFTDPAGDATALFIAESTPAPSAPSLDLTEGTVDYDHETDELVFTVGVTDLTDTPAAGAVGNTYYVNFSARGTQFYAVATYSLVDPDEFQLGDFGGTPGRRFLADIDGAFDVEADTVTLRIPKATLAANGALLRPGDTVGSDGLLAQRYIGVSAVGGATPTADLATGKSYRIPFPDADGDGVRSDADCDDTDATISSGCA